MSSPIIDLIFIRKPNISGANVGTIIKLERVTGDVEINADMLAKTISVFFAELDDASIDASEPVLTVLRNLKSTQLTPAQANDNLAVLKYYGYDFLVVERVDLDSDKISEDTEARGYLLLPQQVKEFSVPLYKLGWGVNFSSIPTYPVGIQAIQEMMALTPEFSKFVPVVDNRNFFKSLQEADQVDYYDNRDSEEFMRALGYEYLLIA